MKKALGYSRISKDEEGSVSQDYQRAEIEKLFLKRGVVERQLHWRATEGRLTDDNLECEFLSYIRAGLNQRERKLISLRTRQALARKKEKGERCGGRPRYGWKVEKRELVREPVEQEAIRRMTALKREGIRDRKGGLFNQTQVCRIMRAA